MANQLKRLEDHIYFSEDAHLKFVDFSKKGGYTKLLQGDVGTADKRTQHFMFQVFAIAERLGVMSDVTVLLL